MINILANRKARNRLLKAVAQLAQTSKKKMSLDYDEDTDTLYIHLPKKKPNNRGPKTNSLILIADEDLIGVSAFGFSRRAEASEELPYDAALEWEGLQNRLRITNLRTPNFLPSVAETILIGRDATYEIVGEVSGKFTSYSEKTSYFLGGFTLGAEIPQSELEGADRHGNVRYELKGCIERGIHQTNGIMTGDYEGYVLVSFLRRTPANNSEESWLTEWLLNGPKDSIYPRFTARTANGLYRRVRIFPENETEILSDPDVRETKRDFALIQLENRSVIIHAVPDKFGPSWSRNIGIEYRIEWGTIPDQHEREMINEIVGFIIGRPLLSIGYTKFDSSGHPIDEVATNPGWPLTRSLGELCQSGDYSPIKLQEVDIEYILNQLAPRYMALRDELNLHEALWRYWISKELPIGTELPALSAGVEGLAQSWFKSTKSKTKGVYLPKREFDRLFEEEFNSANEKLKDQEYRDRILRRMKNAFQMGANERLQFFFDEIGLPVGDVENEAIRSRNLMAHGSATDYSDREIERFVQIRRAYQTLFNRIMLKILGFTGGYVDRSSLNWPERGIDQPMQGPLIEI